MFEIYVAWGGRNETWCCKHSEAAFRLMDIFEQQGATSLHLYPKIPFFYDEWMNHRWDIL